MSLSQPASPSWCYLPLKWWLGSCDNGRLLDYDWLTLAMVALSSEPIARRRGCGWSFLAIRQARLFWPFVIWGHTTKVIWTTLGNHRTHCQQCHSGQPPDTQPAVPLWATTWHTASSATLGKHWTHCQQCHSGQPPDALPAVPLRSIAGHIASSACRQKKALSWKLNYHIHLRGPLWKQIVFLLFSCIRMYVYIVDISNIIFISILMLTYGRPFYIFSE